MKNYEGTKNELQLKNSINYKQILSIVVEYHHMALDTQHDKNFTYFYKQYLVIFLNKKLVFYTNRVTYDLPTY